MAQRPRIHGWEEGPREADFPFIESSHHNIAPLRLHGRAGRVLAVVAVLVVLVLVLV